MSASVGSQLRATLLPGASRDEDGLPPLLILLTVVTGTVDALAFLGLGRVFVANMTGNVVFLGFAAAGAPGLSVGGSLVAIACFLPGGVAAGRLGARLGEDKRRLLHTAASVELALVLAAVVVAAIAADRPDSASRYALTALLALAMGVQNATARRLAVADLSTTVLTLTLTGIAADSRLGGGSGSHTFRRLLSVAAMLLGAVLGALLLREVDPWAPVTLAAVLLALVVAALCRSPRRPSA
jgi:uncharacterized membrane protein YoaK (UPF0700 family)